jgi:hypothetical protein
MLDPKAFGKSELADALRNHTRLASEAAAADEALTGARAALKDAQEGDLAASVSARVEGKTHDEEKREESAEIALKAAEYDSTAARSAVHVAQARVAELAAQPEYDAALGEQEAKATKAALAALATLEKLLETVAEARAYRDWLGQPTLNDHRLREPSVRDVWIGAESMCAPNGEHARSKDLTVPLREALLGNDRAQRPAHEQYGLPVGAHLTGPFRGTEPFMNAGVAMSGGAQRAFEEMLAGGDGGATAE